MGPNQAVACLCGAKVPEKAYTQSGVFLVSQTSARSLSWGLWGKVRREVTIGGYRFRLNIREDRGIVTARLKTHKLYDSSLWFWLRIWLVVWLVWWMW